MRARIPKVIRGTANVFIDLGFADAVERQAKLRLTYEFNRVLGHRGLTQRRAAKLLGLSQRELSALRKYKLAGFSVERLMRLLNTAGQDVEIVIKKNPRSRQAARIIGVAV